VVDVASGMVVAELDPRLGDGEHPKKAADAAPAAASAPLRRKRRLP